MLSTFLLVSALAMSAVLGRSTGPTSTQMTYEKEDQTVMQSEETAQIMAVGDRSSNLKYVMAIKSSSIWEDIKKRSLTINTSQGLDGMVTEKSPDNLSDQELAQLKQACQDGLKCVAVDHLLVLEQVKEQLGGGKVSVRTVITKITQVLTQYTTEYQEDVYQYEAVNDSDDESKVYKSVTTIVEDNKELCRIIDLTPVTEESHSKNYEGNAVPTLVVNNNNTVNYNTTENYNINNGTINSATIDKKPSDIIAVVESPEPGPQTKNNSDSNLVILINPQTESANDYGNTQNRSLSDESVSKALENDAEHNQARQNYAWDNESSDRYYEPVTTTDDHSKYASSAGDNRESAGQQLMITDAPSPYDGVVADNGGREQKARRSLSSVTSETDDDKKNYSAQSPVAPSADRSADTNANERDTGYSDRVENNNVSLKNGVKSDQTAGETDCDQDIVSAGSNNLGIVRKGYVEDGTLNNGNMVQYNINNGTINKGTISNSNAANGIINVGTVNNGPVNYGTLNTYTNNGKQIAMNKFDVQQYLSNIDKMYSTILDRLR